MAFVGSRRNADQDPPDSDGPTGPGPGPHAPPDPTGSVLPPGIDAYLPQRSKRSAMLLAGAATVALGAACIYTFAVDPNNPSNAYPKCPLKAFTGIDCPGCGGLRATNALLHGDILGAAGHNVLAVVLLPIMGYMFARWVLAQFDVTLPKINWPSAFVWITPLVLVAFTIGRNIPIPGLDWLNSA